MTALKLDSPIQYLKGVGPKLAEKLKRLEIETPADLLYHLPRTYIDYSQTVPIKSTRIGDLVVIKGKISDLSIKRTPRKWMAIVEFLVSDHSGSIKVVYFNQPYLKDTFKNGEELYFYGKINYDYSGSIKSLNSPDFSREPKIVPIYPETKNVNSKYLNKLVVGCLSSVDSAREYLPEEIKTQAKLVNIEQALRFLHQPAKMAEVGSGRRRLAFDELYLTALQTQIFRQQRREQKAVRVKIDNKELVSFVDQLPFKLTAAQKRAAWQILLDLRGQTKSGVQESKSPRGKTSGLPDFRTLDWIPPMNRLLNGDVGSGKTVVAAMAAYAVIKAGYRVIVMAPTEVLAFQHYNTFQEILAKYDISVGLATSSRKETSLSVIPVKAGIQTKKTTGSRIKSGMTDKNNKTMKQLNHVFETCDLLVGTHAVLEDTFNHEKVALVVVDEQHRFGVEQRAKIQRMTSSRNVIPAPHPVIPAKAGIQKSSKATGSRIKSGMTNEDKGIQAHFLSMTATPIPRTLQLTLYGDLDVSVIDEMPKGRKEIETKVFADRDREKAYDLIRDQVKLGRQVFIVCPLIEENQEQGGQRQSLQKEQRLALPELDRKTVVAEQKRLKEQVFPDLKIGLMHGKLKPKEKEVVMNEFTSRKLDILVSTSVVEVGVDVPNASVMMVENAERFGLAQLHQFRGRVGRAEHQSYCLLMSSSPRPENIKRLKAMETHASGFKLAEIDLELRGPGVIYGKEQSGFGDLRLDWVSDIFLLEEAREAAKKTLTLNASLSSWPGLREKLGEKFGEAHLE